MQVIGFCRFSYPALGGFQVEHSSLEERVAYLYRSNRMEDRFRHFETVCLPSIQAQTDQDFRFIILIGDTLPAPYIERLFDICATTPQIEIVARPSGNHRTVCAEVLNHARSPGKPCLQFRHDDDDAVSLDFVARLREASRDAAPLIARSRYVAIDFAKGHIVEPDAKGLKAQETYHPFWGVALGMAVRADDPQTIMNFNHHKMPMFMPSVSYADSAMYLRGHNDHNDSRQQDRGGPKLKRLSPEAEIEIRERFAVDADYIRLRFA